jgi:hypothetical protein
MKSSVTRNVVSNAADWMPTAVMEHFVLHKKAPPIRNGAMETTTRDVQSRAEYGGSERTGIALWTLGQTAHMNRDQSARVNPGSQAGLPIFRRIASPMFDQRDVSGNAVLREAVDRGLAARARDRENEDRDVCTVLATVMHPHVSLFCRWPVRPAMR